MARRFLRDVKGITVVWVSVALVVLGCIVVVAVRADGAVATDVELDDGVVWVTNQELGLVGRLNVEIDEIDTAVLGAPLGLDVKQEGRRVVFAAEAGGVQKLDVANGGAVGNNQVPIVAYQMAGGVAVVYDEAGGALWTASADNVAGSSFPDQPDALVEPGSKVVVTAATSQTRIPAIDDGTDLPLRGKVMVLSNDGWRELALDPNFAPVRADADPTFVPPTTLLPPTTVPNEPPPTVAPPEILPMPPVRAGVSVTDVAGVSAVGPTPIVVTNDNKVVLDEEHAVSLEGTGGRVQQVSEAAGAVYVATDRALFRVALDGDHGAKIVASFDGGRSIGTPSQPVQVGGCAYAAWSSEQPTYVRWCEGDEVATPLPIPGAQAGVELTWRVNQHTVALNSPGNGDAWANHDGALSYVGNWADVQPESNVETVTESIGESEHAVDRRCQEGYATAPVAGDDRIGVRPRQSTLEVLTNDDDFDCEPFRIDSVTPADGEFGALTIIDGGQRLLWSPSAAALDGGFRQFSFQYVLVDAAGHRSEPATVGVEVIPDSKNRPPALISNGATAREMVSVVEEGRSTRYDVLADWTDPDGDELEVTDAAVTGTGTVSTDRDGAVTFNASGASPGIAKVNVTVGDGRAETVREWSVTVAPRGTELSPNAQDDFVVVAAGATATVTPLANDSDPNQDGLSLQPLWGEIDGLRTRTVEGEVTIAPDAPGVYRLDYAANDGTSAAPGTAAILVTAVDDAGGNSAPVAVPDAVQIRSGRVLNIDVLENDVDADGDTLAIAEVTASDGIRATIVDRHLLQVEVPDDGSVGANVERFGVTYRVVDGHERERQSERTTANTNTAAGTGDPDLRAFGTLRVETIPADQDLPPVPERDLITVRTGEIASVPVLANDTDPDADEMQVTGLDQQQVEALETAAKTVVWADDTRVYAYGVAPGRYSVTYAVTANGVAVSSEVTIVVTAPADPESNPNSAPEPAPRLVRAVRGGTVRVQLPLGDADPDGDPVTLVGGLRATRAGGGNSVAVDPDDPTVLLYTADLNSPGTDRFSYTVADRLGARGTGVVDVMVVDDEGWSPQAHDDVYRVKPGRTLVVPALDNDTSPQDYELAFANPPFFDRDGQPSPRPVNGEAVEIMDQSDPDRQGMMAVVAPTDRSTLVEQYRVTDGTSTSSAFVRITPDPGAPNRGPLVGDDTVTPDDIAGLGVGDDYAVDVLANDFDADDADNPDALAMTVPAFEDARADGGQVVVTLSDRPQTVVYRATDADGASGVGLVQIPGVGNRPPELSEVGRNPDARVIPAGSDDPLPVKLADVVTDPDGDKVAFTETPPKVVGGTATITTDESGFTIVPAPNRTQSEIVAVEIEVTDRPSLSAEARQDPACNCLATLVVHSIIEQTSAPRVIRAGAVNVPQLGEPVTYDISSLIVDEDGDPLSYDLIQSSFDGLGVSLNGSLMRIVSPTERPIGDKIFVRYTATDRVNEPVSNVVVVTIVGSNRAAPRTGTLGPFDATIGADLDLPNLVDAAFNPFDDRPLRLTQFDVTGGATLSCTESGACTFRSDSDSLYRATVSYTVTDALGRDASGSFEVRIKGTPLAPNPPEIESVGDGEVTITWTQPNLRGGVLQRYQVRVVETGQVIPSGTTGATITGLTNQQTYRFEVQAINDVGEGEWSPPSTGATPDRAPDPPISLTFPDFDDATLWLSWSPPTTTDQYSPITRYEIELSDGQSFLVDAPSTERVVGKLAAPPTPALQNGDPYTFRARSKNSADQNGGWSQWSPWSASEKPARYPDPPGRPTAVHIGDPDEPGVLVTWKKPFEGGRPIDGYEVCTTGNSKICVPVGAQANEARIFGLIVGQSYTFTVTARNVLPDPPKRNTSDPATTGSVTVVGRPKPPVLSTPEVGDGALTVGYTFDNTSGCDKVSFEFSIDGGTTWQPDKRFTGLANGRDYAIVGRAVLGQGCGTPGENYVSANSDPVTGTPIGELAAPTVYEPTITRGTFGQTTYRWDVAFFRNLDGQGPATYDASGCSISFPVFPGPVDTAELYLNFDNHGQTETCTVTITTDYQTKSTVLTVNAWPAPSSGLTPDPNDPNKSIGGWVAHYPPGKIDGYPDGRGIEFECLDYGENIFATPGANGAGTASFTSPCSKAFQT